MGIQEELIQFWVKVCDVLVEHYGTPQRAEWNRLLCTIELIPAFVRAQARQGEHDPESARNVTVFAALPWVEQTARALEQFDVEDERWMAGSKSLYSRWSMPWRLRPHASPLNPAFQNYIAPAKLK